MNIIPYVTKERLYSKQLRSRLFEFPKSDRLNELVIAYSDRQLTDFLNLAEADGFNDESPLTLLYGFTKLTSAPPDRYFLSQIQEYFNEEN